MKKTYLKPVIEVEQLLIEGLMQDGHSNNRPEAKQGGVWGNGGGQVIENGKLQGNDNLWDD
ncbi:MAG: hypothetical protein J5965_27610 [Aeriscardovia sp.]|jgi:hypothetical protein|nr:hypothetical protein [Aeriscardovia sp.]